MNSGRRRTLTDKPTQVLDKKKIPYLGNEYEPQEDRHAELNSKELQEVNHIRSCEVSDEKSANKL